MIFYGEIVNEWHGVIEGEALVSKRRISFLGDIDPNTGIVRDPHSDIFGENISDKILIFRGGRGSTVGAIVIYSLKRNERAPRALVVVESDPVVVSGAIFSGIPMVSGIPEKVFGIINSGDKARLWIENDKAVVEVIK